MPKHEIKAQEVILEHGGTWKTNLNPENVVVRVIIDDKVLFDTTLDNLVQMYIDAAYTLRKGFHGPRY